MKIPRMTDWLIITLILIALIAALKPELLPVSLYKLSLITMAAVVGYWIDRSLFPYARPDEFFFTEKSMTGDTAFSVPEKYVLIFCAAMLRRAIIVFGAMLAASLGV